MKGFPPNTKIYSKTWEHPCSCNRFTQVETLYRQRFSWSRSQSCPYFHRSCSHESFCRNSFWSDQRHPYKSTSHHHQSSSRHYCYDTLHRGHPHHIGVPLPIHEISVILGTGLLTDPLRFHPAPTEHQNAMR